MSHASLTHVIFILTSDCFFLHVRIIHMATMCFETFPELAFLSVLGLVMNAAV